MNSNLFICLRQLSFIVVADGMKMRTVAQYHELAAEAFYLMAIVFDKLGRLDDREEAAASFKRHILALENFQDEEDPLINMLWKC